MWSVVLVSLVIIVVVYYFFIKNKQCKVRNDDSSYKSKDFLLTKTERTVYETICHYIDNNHLRFKIFPKMRLTDFLWSPKDDRNAYLRINSKFVDFLVVDRANLKPVVAIFILNKENKAKMSSLDIIEPALKSAGVEFVKIDSSKIFEHGFIIDVLKKYLKDI